MTIADMDRLAEELVNQPKRDNSLYHEAIAEARRAFAEAQSLLEGPVSNKVKRKVKKNGTVVIRFAFRPQTGAGK